MTGENEGFATRWSKRKIAAREEGESELQNDTAGLPDGGPQEKHLQNDGPDADQGELLTEDDFADVDFDALDKSSDYTRFIKANVPAAIQKKALRKLWASDSIFEVLDGMNDYDLDYTGDGLAGKVFKSAYEIGRGYPSDEDADAETADEQVVAIADEDETREIPEGAEEENEDAMEEPASITPKDPTPNA